MKSSPLFGAFLCLFLIQGHYRVEGVDVSVDCRDKAVFPWFEGCHQYIQCNGSDATVKQCSQTKAPQKSLQDVCGNRNTCGFRTCVPGSPSKVVTFFSDSNTKTPFYGLCLNGKVVFQGSCDQSDNSKTEFNEESNSCLVKCTNGSSRGSADCKKWFECVNGKFKEHVCPENFFFNGNRCDINYRCPSSPPHQRQPSTRPLPTSSTPIPRRTARTTPRRF